MAFLNPGLLGIPEHLRRQLVAPIQRHDAKAHQRLQRLLTLFVLRRRKSDPDIAPELPPKIEQIEYCSLTREQASLYAAILRDLEASFALPSDQRNTAMFRRLHWLKQCCNHPAHVLGDHSALPRRSGKLERREEIVADALAEGQRCLIFSQYAEMLHLLQPHLADRFGEEVFVLDGNTPEPRRDD